MQLIRFFKLVVFIAATAPRLVHADAFVNEWLAEVNLQSEYAVLKRQIRDFRDYNRGLGQELVYEETGETFENREEVDEALPEKERALERVRRDYARLVGSKS